MFQSSGYFKAVTCPYFASGLCERPYCHFRHVKPTVDEKAGSCWSTSVTPSTSQSGNSSLLAKVGETIQRLQRDIERDQQLLNGHKSVRPKSIESFAGQVAEKYKSRVTLADAKEPEADEEFSYKPTPIAELKKKKEKGSNEVVKQEPAEEVEEYTPAPKKARIESEEEVNMAKFSDDDQAQGSDDEPGALFFKKDKVKEEKVELDEETEKEKEKEVPEVKQEVPIPGDILSQIMNDSSKSLKLNNVKHKKDGSMVILEKKKKKLKEVKVKMEEIPTVEEMGLELSDEEMEGIEEEVQEPVQEEESFEDIPTVVEAMEPAEEPKVNNEELELAKKRESVWEKIRSGSIVLGHIPRDDEVLPKAKLKGETESERHDKKDEVSEDKNDEISEVTSEGAAKKITESESKEATDVASKKGTEEHSEAESDSSSSSHSSSDHTSKRKRRKHEKKHKKHRKKHRKKKKKRKKKKHRKEVSESESSAESDDDKSKKSVKSTDSSRSRSRERKRKKRKKHRRSSSSQSSSESSNDGDGKETVVIAESELKSTNKENISEKSDSKTDKSESVEIEEKKSEKIARKDSSTDREKKSKHERSPRQDFNKKRKHDDDDGKVDKKNDEVVKGRKSDSPKDGTDHVGKLENSSEKAAKIDKNDLRHSGDSLHKKRRSDSTDKRSGDKRREGDGSHDTKSSSKGKDERKSNRSEDRSKDKTDHGKKAKVAKVTGEFDLFTISSLVPVPDESDTASKSQSESELIRRTSQDRRSSSEKKSHSYRTEQKDRVRQKDDSSKSMTKDREMIDSSNDESDFPTFGQFLENAKSMSSPVKQSSKGRDSAVSHSDKLGKRKSSDHSEKSDHRQSDKLSDHRKHKSDHSSDCHKKDSHESNRKSGSKLSSHKSESRKSDHHSSSSKRSEKSEKSESKSNRHRSDSAKSELKRSDSDRSRSELKTQDKSRHKVEHTKSEHNAAVDFVCNLTKSNKLNLLEYAAKRSERSLSRSSQKSEDRKPGTDKLVASLFGEDDDDGSDIILLTSDSDSCNKPSTSRKPLFPSPVRVRNESTTCGSPSRKMAPERSQSRDSDRSRDGQKSRDAELERSLEEAADVDWDDDPFEVDEQSDKAPSTDQDRSNRYTIPKKRVAHHNSGSAPQARRPLSSAQKTFLSPAEQMHNRFKLVQQKQQTASTSESGRARHDHSGFTELGKAAKSRVAHTPKGKNHDPESDHTPVQSAKVSGKRVAHVPKEQVLKRPIIPNEYGSKVPTSIRQRYLNQLIDECLVIYSDQQDAFDRALQEEKSIYERSSSRVVYLNVAVKAIRALRAELAGGANAESRPAVKTWSHEAVLGGAKAAKTTYTLHRSGHGHIKDPSQVELTMRTFWEYLQQYILTDDQLKENGFAFNDPDNPERAIYYGGRETPTVALKMHEKVCCRCGKRFRVYPDGTYATVEECNYHWGRAYKRKISGQWDSRYTCCSGDLNSEPCCSSKLHVHQTNVLTDLEGYVKTFARPPTSDGYGVYALDCEMVYTVNGSELGRVTVIDMNLEPVYETLVKPTSDVIDYNTRFSGLEEGSLKRVKTTLEDVQNKLRHLFSEKTILIGHSLESDFAALKFIHPTVVDTSVVFPHRLGAPYKRALKTLMADILKKIIQNDVGGHDSREDAAACMELMVWKVKEELRIKH